MSLWVFEGATLSCDFSPILVVTLLNYNYFSKHESSAVKLWCQISSSLIQQLNPQAWKQLNSRGSFKGIFSLKNTLEGMVKTGRKCLTKPRAWPHGWHHQSPSWRHLLLRQVSTAAWLIAFELFYHGRWCLHLSQNTAWTQCWIPFLCVRKDTDMGFPTRAPTWDPPCFSVTQRWDHPTLQCVGEGNAKHTWHHWWSPPTKEHIFKCWKKAANIFRLMLSPSCPLQLLVRLSISQKLHLWDQTLKLLQTISAQGLMNTLMGKTHDCSWWRNNWLYFSPFMLAKREGETEQPRSCSADACSTVLSVQRWKDVMAWPAGTDRMNPQFAPGPLWD